MERYSAVLHLDYLSCFLTIASTMLVGRRKWQGWVVAAVNSVIISIIGGEDMRLLEIDEAANHIRELVDPEANIIWGSAFNPELEGRIRVSVVATGIEQSAEMAERASQPLNLSAARGPKKPVLPLPTEEELHDMLAGRHPARRTAFKTTKPVMMSVADERREDRPAGRE